MNDAQLVAIAITVLAILGGTLVNNSRIGDVNNRIADSKELLRAEMKLGEARLEAKMDAGFASMDARFGAMDRKLDEILRILGNHDTRISAIEQRS